MEFFVNGEKLDIVLEDEKTVGDVLKSFEAECEKINATTINIVLNGKNITAQEFDSIFAEPLKDDTKLEVSIITQEEIRESLQGQIEECNTLSSELTELSLKLQSGKANEATSLITKLADFIEQFCHFATLSALFPAIYEKLKFDGKTINEFFQDFSQILGDFEQAITSNDTVLLGDLAEYEISPRLEAITATIKEL